MKKSVILMFCFMLLAVMTASSQTVQCSGTTQKGNRCKRMTTNPNGYCYQHQDQAFKAKIEKEDQDDTVSIKTEKKSMKNSETKTKQEASPAPVKSSYGGREIHTGPRGGKYYINSKGNKTYVKRKK